jgi:Tol biopolymer transport system component
MGLAVGRHPEFGLFRRGLFFAILLAISACHRNSSAQIESVAISPNGKLLLVDLVDKNSSLIYKVDLASGNAIRLTGATTGAESSPAFSPDGRQVAYTYFSNNQPARIATINVDGSHPRAWPSSGSGDYWPTFSLDGKTIVFARFAYNGSYSPVAQPHPHEWDLYAADSDGENVRQLTHQAFYNASPVSISPDDKRMVAMTESADASPELAIYSLDHPEKPAMALQPHVPGEPRTGPVFESPSFMPDGKSLIFMAASNGSSGFDYDVYTVGIVDGSVEKLTQGNGFATGLSVSADGKTAVFLKWRLNWQKRPVECTPYLLDVQSHKLTPLIFKGLPF